MDDKPERRIWSSYNQRLDSTDQILMEPNGVSQLTIQGSSTSIRLSNSLAVTFIVTVSYFIFARSFAQEGKSVEERDMFVLGKVTMTAKMYMTDYDEVFPVYYTLPKDLYCNPTNPNSCDWPGFWHFRLLPYVRDFDEFRSPVTGQSKGSGEDSLRFAYAMNVNWISTVCPTHARSLADYCANNEPWHPGYVYFRGVNSLTVADPANTVFFTAGPGPSWFFRKGMFFQYAVTPPDARTSSRSGLNDGHKNLGGWGFDGRCMQPLYDNVYTGGVGYRHGARSPSMRHVDGRAPFAFVDGSVRAMRAAAAAAGTDYGPDVPCSQTRVTDPSRYLWDTY